MLSVLIIGTGGIARRHAEVYRSMADRVRITGIADADRARAEDFASRHTLQGTPGFALFADYRDALSLGSYDIVSICTPPPPHRAIAVDCLNAGANVLLEKPMALSLAECDRILQAAEKNGRFVSVVAQNRYDTGKARIQRLIAEGRCGRVLYAQAYSAWWRGREYYNTWHGSWDTEGGGCTLNLAVHQIDLLLWIAGKPGEVSAFMTNVNHANAQVEDLSLAILRFAEGPAAGGLGEILGSTIHHGEGQQMVFQTERAGLTLPFQIRCTRERPGGYPEPDPETIQELEAFCQSYPPLEKESHAGQIADFVSLIETGVSSPFLPDGTSGRAAIEVVTGIYKSAATGRPASLPIVPDDPFYTRLKGLE